MLHTASVALRPHLSSTDTVSLMSKALACFSFRLGVTLNTRVPSAAGCEMLMPLGGKYLALELCTEILRSFCAVSGSLIFSENANLPLFVPVAVLIVCPAPTMVGGDEWNLTPLRPVLPPYLGNRDGAALNNTCGVAPTWQLAGGRQGGVAQTRKHGCNEQCCVRTWPAADHLMVVMVVCVCVCVCVCKVRAPR